MATKKTSKPKPKKTTKATPKKKGTSTLTSDDDGIVGGRPDDRNPPKKP